MGYTTISYTDEDGQRKVADLVPGQVWVGSKRPTRLGKVQDTPKVRKIKGFDISDRVLFDASDHRSFGRVTVRGFEAWVRKWAAQPSKVVES